MYLREAPPTRLHIDAETPSGRHYRWGADEPNPANVLRDLRFSTIMPGGFDSLDVTLPRKTATDYSDLERLSTLRVLGAGGEVAGEYRLERAPRTSGNEVSVSPGAVGWQAHLEDDKSASEVYVDADLGHWGGLAAAYRAVWLASGYSPSDPEVLVDNATGLPALLTKIEDEWTAASMRIALAFYDAGPGNTVGSIYYDMFPDSTVGGGWTHAIYNMDNDAAANITSIGTLTSGTAVAQYTTPATPRRVIELRHLIGAAFLGTAGAQYGLRWRKLTAYGNHGLTKQGTAPGGFYASDVIANAVGRWAPLLDLTTGSDGSVQVSSFVIPHLEFREPTTAAEIVKQANRFHLRDWAVWEDKTFHYHDRGARGRRWRARIAPAQLSETGPQVDRLWNGAIVKFNDVDGTSKTVGPVGSGADTETAVLEDDDPENPVNQLGIRRWTLLDMGGVSTVAGATQVGQIFMEQSKLLDSSGQAQLVGVVEDDRGIQRPSWQVRAGDYITFVDAADSSARRIVKTDYSHDTRTCSIDLDAPPEGMDALLERLGVALQPLGL